MMCVSDVQVKVFGSYKTDLYLPTSDIDLVVMCDDVDSQTALKMLEQKLIEKNAYDDVKVIKTSVSNSAVSVLFVAKANEKLVRSSQPKVRVD